MQRISVINFQLAWRDVPEDSNLPSDISWQLATTTTNSNYGMAISAALPKSVILLTNITLVSVPH